MSQGGEFSKFIAEFGSSKEEDEKREDEDENDIDEVDAEGEMKKMEKMKTAVAGDALMQTEERNTGAISGKVYKRYMNAGRGQIILPFLLLSLVLLQGSTILSSYWFVDFWTISEHLWLTRGYNLGWFGGRKSLYSTCFELLGIY